MQTIDEVREHCRFVGKGIEKMVAEGEDLNAKFEGQITMLRFKLEKDGGSVKVVGGEKGGDLTYSHRPGGGRGFTLRPNKAHRAGAAKAR